MKKVSQKGVSIILILVLLVSVLVGDIKITQADEKTEQVAHYLKPYQTTNMVYYSGDPTKSFYMMGNEYFYGLVPENWGNFKQILYNLDGQFKNVTLDVGHWDGWNDTAATLYVYMDNELVKEVALTNDMVNQSLSLNTDNVKQLKLQYNKYGAFYGVGNVIGYGGHNYSEEIVKVPSPIDSGTRKYSCVDCDYSYEEVIPANDVCTPYLTPYQTTNLVSYETTKDLTDYFCVMGKKYYKGMVPENWGDKKEALYNLGKKYKSVSFYVGHWDNWESDSVKLYVYLDGTIVKEIALSIDMISEKITLDTENISQMKLVYDCYGAFYSIYDMEYIAKEPMSHVYKEEEILTPSIEGDGIMKYTCEKCDASYTETILYKGDEESAPTEKPEATPTIEPTEKPKTTPTLKPTEKPETTPTLKPTEKSETTPTLKSTDNKVLKKIKLFSVKCKKNTKKITGKVSVSKATIEIKIGKKKYKKAILKGKKFTFKTGAKLKKGTRVTFKVTKKNYKKLIKTYVVK